MACPFAGNRRNCPANRRRASNGAIRCAGNTAAAQAAATAERARIAQQAAQATLADGATGVCNQSVGAQLYGASTSLADVPTVCCDPLCNCRTYPIGCRNSYWPTFAHPRWLSCNQLYNRRRR